jgi:hypothetical protein
VTPFDWTNRRLHSAAASFLVIFAEGFLKGFLKWQNPAAAFGELVSSLVAGLQKDLRSTSVPHGTPLADQHAVAVTVEAVARFDGVAVRRENIFAAGESTDQREQRRARQVKVCQ